MEQRNQINHKKLSQITGNNPKEVIWLKDYYKIIYIEKGDCLDIDFEKHCFEKDALLFLSIGQFFKAYENSTGDLIYFGPDFYCISFHDRELACDGILFDNVFELPYILLTNQQQLQFKNLIYSATQEIFKRDYWADEMIKTYIKQIIILSTRILSNPGKDELKIMSQEKNLARKFGQLVEQHYREYHDVGKYAELLNITPKSLNRKIVAQKNVAPRLIIKQRIILQAKRMLANTTFSIKEIAVYLGYLDYSYFVRFFKIQTGKTPLDFRKTIKS